MSWFRVQRDGATAQVHIADGIGFGACDVSELIADLAGATRINLTVSSSGGCGRTGDALYTALRGRTPEAVILGDCASAAALIVLAADRVIIHPEGRIMLHSPSACTFATAAEMREQADHLDRLTAVWIDRLRERSGADPAMVRGWFDGKDHWFDAQEAVAAGLADELLAVAPRPGREAAEIRPVPSLAEAAHAEEALLLDLLRALGTVKTTDKGKLFRNLSSWFGTSIHQIAL